MRHLTPRLVAVAALMATTTSIASCSGQTRTHRAATSAATASASATSSVTAADELDTKDAKPVTSAVLTRTVKVPGARADGRWAGVQAIASDGRLLVTTWHKPKVGNEEPELVGDVGVELWGPHGVQGVMTDGATRVGGPSQIIASAPCSPVRVWVETHSVDLDHQDWRVWTAKPGARPRLLGSSDALLPGLNPLSPALYVSDPAVGAGVAYWPITVPASGPDKAKIASGWQGAIASTPFS